VEEESFPRPPPPLHLPHRRHRHHRRCLHLPRLHLHLKIIKLIILKINSIIQSFLPSDDSTCLALFLPRRAGVSFDLVLCLLLFRRAWHWEQTQFLGLFSSGGSKQCA